MRSSRVRWFLHVVAVMFLASACGRPFGADATVDDDAGPATQSAPAAAAEASAQDASTADGWTTTDASTFDATSDGPPPLVPVWEKDISRWGGSYTAITDVAVDANDRVIVTGSCTTDTAYPCSGLYGDFGGYDFKLGKKSGNTFVVSYDIAGAPLWDKVWEADMEPVSPLVATDAAGNVFVVMTVTGSIDFGGGMRNLSSAFVIASYDSAGAYRWDRVIPSDSALGRISAFSVAAGPADEVVISGIGNTWDGIVIAFGANGVTRWTKFVEGSPSTAFGAVHSVGVDTNGRVVALGRHVDPTDLGGGVRSGPAFLASWSSTGAWQWDVAPPSYDLNVAIDGTDVFTAGSDAALTRRTYDGTIVYSVPSEQTWSCSAGYWYCALLPFAVSPAYDEIWYRVSETESTVARRKKSDGSAVTKWTPAFGPAAPYAYPYSASVTPSDPAAPRKLVVMPQGDIVAVSSIGVLVNQIFMGATVGRVTRFARPQ